MGKQDPYSTLSEYPMLCPSYDVEGDRDIGYLPLAWPLQKGCRHQNNLIMKVAAGRSC